jgi:hypothetical protein
MTVYSIAQLKFTNIEAYRRYQKAFPAVLARFKAKVLAAQEIAADRKAGADAVIVLVKGLEDKRT